jgi:glycosyltransferase involved in cell wall biosynthesis
VSPTEAPGLSILMPVYNAGRYLAPAVASAVEQFGPDDELVVQDGGSSDGSIAALAQRYRDDPRVSIVSEPDAGQSDALQRALARARRPYLGWLNADDVYYPGALDAVRAALRAEPRPDVVYGDAAIFAGDDRVLRRVQPGEFSVRGFVQHGCHVFSGATFLRTDLVRAAGGFDRDLHYAMDFDLFLRVAAAGPRCVKLDHTLGGLRWHEASKSGSVTLPFFKEAMRIRLRYARTPRDRLHVYAQMSRRLAAVPLIPLRNSAAFGRLRKVKTY